MHDRESDRGRSTGFDPVSWDNQDSALLRHIAASNDAALAAYEANPPWVFEHANIERATAQGGYGRRQLYELIQNGADALVGTRGGRIHVVLTEDALYCANEGEPIDEAGVTALLNSHISRKRGTEIGRFGLGFKSVLGVTDRPEFYSWTGSFTFNAGWCREQILGRLRTLTDVNEDDRTPTLRMAKPADPVASAERDPILKELMAWATTVVKLPQTMRTIDNNWLADDLKAFPRAFMLFSPHVAQLRLEDRVSYLDRTIEVTVEDNIHYLREGSDESRWHVFELPDHRPTAAALKDAGELAHRETVQLIWAVPTHGKERLRRGRFWAFFPTEYETTLAGIINAPWKTNEDRQNLLPGAFNDELVGVVVDLIIENLGTLVDPDDPGSYLELLPARGREAPSPTDRLLTELFYERAALTESLPDQLGVLRAPALLRLHPAVATPRSLEHWSEYPNRPIDWCHPSVFQRDRRACAERLIDGLSADVDEWLEALVEDGTPEASIAAIRAAAALSDEREDLPIEVESAKIILTTQGRLVVPDPDQVFLPFGIEEVPATMELVHPAVVADPETMLALETLGIRPADALAGLRGLVARRLTARTNWDAFWRLTRAVSVEDSGPLIATAQHRPSLYGASSAGVHVKAADGGWKPLRSVLLPGEIVPTGEPGDEAVTIDTDFHAGDLELLERLGARGRPEAGGGDTNEPWFPLYRDQAVMEYYAGLESRARPREDYLVFDRKTFVGPLGGLRLLSSTGKARLSEAALAAVRSEGADWTMSHRTMNTYPDQVFISPALWLLKEDGYLRTSLGPAAVSETLGADLRRWSAFFPVAVLVADRTEDLDLPSTLEEVSDDQWRAAIERAQSADAGPKSIGGFYAAACGFCESPAMIRCRVGDADELRSPAEVTAVNTREHFDTLCRDETPVLLVESEDAAGFIVDEWGLIPASEAVRTTYSTMPTTLGSTVASRFPDLAMMRHDIGSLILQPCESILAVTFTDRGRATEERDFVIDGESIFYKQELTESELLMELSNALELDLGPEEIDSIVEGVRDADRRTRLRDIAAEPDEAVRLSRLLDRDAIARRLPEGLLGALEERGFNDDQAMSRAAFAVYGVGVLRAYEDDLRVAGWNPPTTWAGSRDARTFVRELGFDSVHAGGERRSKPPNERVAGPALLPPMHDFQDEIAEVTRELLRKKGGGRALLSLPTGAGKTRIAVQAIVEAVKDDEIGGPILWIAQTEELCEQAVETWSFVWRAMGPQRTLQISRLWGSHETDPAESVVQVVVTTIAKVVNRVDDPTYDWLGKADCVVIDEAHGSTTPSYTKVLDWLGIGRNKERIPLVGLTATPFRGTSTEQTRRLVNRYGQRRLDYGVFDGNDPYAYLQDMEVLAQVDHQILQGSDIVLTPDELTELEQRRRLPSHIGERIGADQQRNATIIDMVSGLDDRWPVLLFAASVDHAQTLAALFTMEGIASAAVSGQTDRHARRHYIEQFRSGDIRVLANYNVLTQGFDAPATRAVVVARPTFSANLYQQMIGRGLRGPLNGGKERCLIVNVADNVVQYGESLAFYDFEYLWNRSEDEQ